MTKVPGIRRPPADEEHSFEQPVCADEEHRHMQEDPPRPVAMVAFTDHWLCPEQTVAVPWERDRVPVGTQNRAQRRRVSKIVARGNRRR